MQLRSVSAASAAALTQTHLNTYTHIVWILRNFSKMTIFPSKNNKQICSWGFLDCKQCWAGSTCVKRVTCCVSPAVRPWLRLFTGSRPPHSISFFPGAEAKCFSLTAATVNHFISQLVFSRLPSYLLPLFKCDPVTSADPAGHRSCEGGGGRGGERSLCPSNLSAEGEEEGGCVAASSISYHCCQRRSSRVMRLLHGWSVLLWFSHS